MSIRRVEAPRPPESLKDGAQRETLESPARAPRDRVEGLAAARPALPNLRFELDAATGKTIVFVIDAASGDVVRQIPAKEVIALAKALDRLEAAFLRLKI